MRQAINNLQSTNSGFGLISPDNVYKVCDQPHPVLVQEIIKSCTEANVENALNHLEAIWALGFSSADIVATVFKIVKAYDMPEMLKLEYIKVRLTLIQIIGTTHMRLLEGCQSLLQLSGMVARLCRINLGK